MQKCHAANPMSFTFMLLMPTTSPSKLHKGPPELPYQGKSSISTLSPVMHSSFIEAILAETYRR
jgi:hypothetical protein